MSAHSLKLPELGLDDRPIVLSMWLVRQGATVAEDEPVVEVLCGGVTVDLPAPAAGVLVEKLARTGDVLAVGQRLAVIDTEA